MKNPNFFVGLIIGTSFVIIGAALGQHLHNLNEVEK